MKTYNIASIEGDGIGKEVVPEAHKVLKKIAEKHRKSHVCCVSRPQKEGL